VSSLVLAACGQPSGTTAPAATAAPKTAAPAAQPTAATQAKPAAPSGAAASSDWNTVVEAAKQEGALVISSHAGSGYEKYLEEVKKALPEIRVEATNMRASDFTARVVTEQKNGQFLWDVHMGPVSNIFTVMTPAGGLEPIKPYLDALPAELKDNAVWAGGFELYTDPANPVTLITQLAESGGIYVNLELAPEGISKPEDLLDPKWKGKIAVYDPTVSNGGSMSLSGLQASKGTEFVRQLIMDNDARYVETARQLTEWIAQGRYPIAFGVDDTYLAELKQQGVGAKVERNKEFATYALASGVSVLKNAPHPNAVKLYLNWALSHAGQDAWARLASVDSSSRRLDVETYHPNGAADYKNMGKYTAIQGTASGDASLKATLEVTKAK
jgi:iron(III) transport system substrate-binding protein